MIDTHTHLYASEFDGQHREAVDRAIASGVEHMVFPNIDLDSVGPMKELSSLYPSTRISMAMGLHPTEVKESWRDDLATIHGHLTDPSHSYVAVGEIGIDLYWDQTHEREQMLALDEQLRWATELDLPVIIHCRNGLDQILEVMQAHASLRAVFHSFGGTEADVSRIRRHGDHYFGINGIVTFKNSKLRDTLPSITLDRIVLETDSPYLAPVPHRGKRNESAYLPYIARHIAATLDVPLEEVDRATTANAITLFKLPIIPSVEG